MYYAVDVPWSAALPPDAGRGAPHADVSPATLREHGRIAAERLPSSRKVRAAMERARGPAPSRTSSGRMDVSPLSPFPIQLFPRPKLPQAHRCHRRFNNAPAAMPYAGDSTFGIRSDLRRRNEGAWAAQLFKLHTQDWLQQRRAEDEFASMYIGRTGTRIAAGKVQVRWHDGAEAASSAYAQAQSASAVGARASEAIRSRALG